MMVCVHKIALDPNTGRRRLRARHAGYGRGAYDWGLARFKRGLDVGVEALATLSDGTAHPDPRPLAGARRRLRRRDKSIARSRKANPNLRPRGRERLYAAHEGLRRRVRSIRDDAQHKAATDVARRAGTGGVAVEDLHVAGMMKNDRPARALAETAMGVLLREIECLCVWRGAPYPRVDRWLPSSRTSSACGRIHEIPSSARTLRCGCARIMDRDHNAASNIAAAGRSPEALNGRGEVAPVMSLGEASARASIGPIHGESCRT